MVLPEDPALFREAFDSACKRILDSEMDATFYDLYSKLIYNLREHLLFKEYIISLEDSLGKQKQEFNSVSLEAVEDAWKRLWKYHRHSLMYRKQLVRIKQIITAPNETSFSALYQRILFAMWEFRYCSSFFRFISRAPWLYRTAQSDRELTSIRLEHQYSPESKYFSFKKVLLQKLSKKNKIQVYIKKLCISRLEREAMPFRWTAECAISALVSKKIDEVNRKYFVPGMNNTEKRRNMQILAETDPTFCWKRVLFLFKCYFFSDSKPKQKPLKGRWASVRNAAWQTAQEKCEIEVLLGVRMALAQKLSIEPLDLTDSLLDCEDQFYRSDFEYYLKALQKHIHSQLFVIEDAKLKDAKDQTAVLSGTPVILPGTQKGSFIIDLAMKYWKKHPSANHDEVFQDYLAHCPSGRILSRSSWERMVRERKLDPRSPKEKKRGRGKKTSQN